MRKTKRQLLDDIEHLQRQVNELKLAASGQVSGTSLKDRVAESYRIVVEDQTEMIARHLPNGILTFVNRAYCQHQKRTRKELIGTNYFFTLSPKLRKEVRKNIDRLSVKTPVVTHEQRVITLQGEERWQQWVNRGIFDQSGRMTEFQSVGRDVTELKKIEQVLKVKEVLLLEKKEILKRKNMALHEILEQIEVEKKQIKDDMVHNVETLLLPTLRKFRNQLPRVEPKYLTLLEKNLINMVSSFGRKISRENLHLTPREIEICDLIKNGFTSKEVSDFLHIAFNTVEVHRTHIREKLKLSNKKINLTSFLNTMD